MRNTQMRPVLEKNPKKTVYSIKGKSTQISELDMAWSLLFCFGVSTADSAAHFLRVCELWSQAVVDDRG